MTNKTIIAKIKKATDLIADIADYYEKNHLKINNDERKGISDSFVRFAEMYDCLDEIVSTYYKAE